MRAECAGADTLLDADDLAAILTVGGGGEERVSGCIAGAGTRGCRFVVMGRIRLDLEGADGGVLWGSVSEALMKYGRRRAYEILEG